jgi:2-polyprenyl-3-methyl-5-hydroxy-6-metoxy-1,4-benzoquinol methylase
MTVPAITEYERRTTHSRNPLARFSHRARLREAMTLIRQHLPKYGTMLDFGCCGGELLRQVRQEFPAGHLYGLDPFSSPGEGYSHLRASSECGELSFDVITAFEVLEHLNVEATGAFFALVRKHLVRTGVCIVSAPNMLGPVLLPKLLHALLAGGSALNYDTAEAAHAALLLRSPQRLPQSVNGTMRHKGYDWRQSRARIAQEFAILSERFTPLPHLWWGFNSQWFCVFQRRQWPQAS